MRPRVIPAEDTNGTAVTAPGARSFNEAAGNPRGRHPNPPPSPSSTSRFNEAAGNPRGRRLHSLLWSVFVNPLQ